MKKITIVSASFRHGNSYALAKAFEEGARFAGNEVTFLELNSISLKYCLGCLYCQKTGVCVQKDDINSLLDTISNSDCLVFATPVYYYELSGQLKTFLDRLNPLYIRDNRFKEVYLLCSAADTDPNAIAIPKTEIGGWISCFPGVELKGSMLAYGVTDPTDIDATQFKEEAYNMGRNA